MYISYSNLWKTMIDKNISKTELIELTGLSSRTIAKLTKNQTVTTETLLRLCEVLECGLDDIMEIHDGEGNLTFAEAFDKSTQKTDEDEFFNTYRLEYGGVVYVIKKTKKSAAKRVMIDCADDTVTWKYLYNVGMAAIATENTVICRTNFAAKGERGIVLISGKPGTIQGLDSGNFVSSRGSVKSDRDVYVMSSAAFKLFSPKEYAEE